MYRGQTIFICNDCGKVFVGPDFELTCTVLTMPVTCPVCGGSHTYVPAYGRGVYRIIWAMQDREQD